MLLPWILLLYSSVQFVSSEAERLNGTSCSTETLRKCNVSAGTTQNWVKCRYHSDCLHGGSCELDSNNELSCKCKAGWTGRDCNATCKNGKNCVCPDGWGGLHCDEAMVTIESIEELNCKNGFFVDNTCICNLGYHGAACNVFNCSQGECGVRGACSRNGTYCECDSGWSGLLCDDNWINFQRRMIFDIEFNKTFSEYEQGFGDIRGDGDFWLGLKKIHDYTKNGAWELRIDVIALNGSKYFSEYSGFKVLDPPLYNITWSSKSGGNINDQPGWGMNYHKNAPFSAWNRDQDNSNYVCSKAYGYNGWWFNYCAYVYLNADRQTSSTIDHSRMAWWTGSSEWIPLIGSTMSMRRLE